MRSAFLKSLAQAGVTLFCMCVVAFAPVEARRRDGDNSDNDADEEVRGRKCTKRGDVDVPAITPDPECGPGKFWNPSQATVDGLDKAARARRETDKETLKECRARRAARARRNKRLRAARGRRASRQGSLRAMFRFLVPDHFRIVGGEEATRGQFPFQASFQKKADNYHFCAAVMVSETHLVTAAHCVVEKVAEDLQIVLGEHNLKEDDGNEQIFEIAEMLVHPQYDRANSGTNDIAIIKIAAAATLNDFVQTVAMAERRPDEDVTMTVSGWGTVAQEGTAPDTLQFVEVMTNSTRECKCAYGAWNIDDTMICASDHEKDACQGDSGGPLAKKEDDGTYTLHGLVSWGTGCAVEGFPGVYTSISKFNKWIKGNI